VLRLISFTSINLTEIADWGPSSYPLQVTNLNYEDALTNNNPVRGHALTNTSSTATLTGTATSRKYNSGLLDVISGAFELGTSLPDHTTYAVSDTQTFAVGGGGGGGNDAGDGTVTLTRVNYVPGNAFSVNANVTGGTQNQPCNPLSNNTTCSIDGSASTGLTFVNGVSFKVSAYNSQATSTAQTSPTLTGCVGTGIAANLAPKDLPNGTSYTGSVCKNWAISSATAVPTAGAATISLVVPADSGKLAEASLVSFPTGAVANNATITLNFTLEGATPQTASSCTYTCGGQGQLKNPNHDDCANNSDPVFTAVFPACP
jgi:hypothetical protein